LHGGSPLEGDDNAIESRHDLSNSAPSDHDTEAAFLGHVRCRRHRDSGLPKYHTIVRRWIANGAVAHLPTIDVAELLKITEGTP
jgi:hypothetical protein